MNKILALLVVLVIVYQSFSPLVKVFTKNKKNRRVYNLTFSKQFNHLFSATLLLVIPLLFLSNYYGYYLLLPIPVQIGLAVLISLCWISAGISFYLYVHYVKKTSYQSLLYDRNLLTVELISHHSRQLIKLKEVKGVKWVGIKKYLRMMPWSNFEYLVLEFGNGTNLIITSLIMPPDELHDVLARFEVMHKKKIIPTIR